jgi:hypothetical protein
LLELCTLVFVSLRAKNKDQSTKLKNRIATA